MARRPWGAGALRVQISLISVSIRACRASAISRSRSLDVAGRSRRPLYIFKLVCGWIEALAAAMISDTRSWPASDDGGLSRAAVRRTSRSRPGTVGHSHLDGDSPCPCPETGHLPGASQRVALMSWRGRNQVFGTSKPTGCLVSFWCCLPADTLVAGLSEQRVRR